MKIYKNPITIRSGHLTCPLPLALEAYWACEADCYHCIGRRLNKIWGNEQRMTDPEAIFKKLTNSLKKENKTILSQALYRKKAFFLGRKADPYQPIELKERITKKLIEILFELDWEFAVCSRYQNNMEQDTDLFRLKPNLIHMLVEITPGLEADREIFERNRTATIQQRLTMAKKWQKLGISVGVRGEPFIPGHHTFKQFKETLKLLKEHNIKSYNTYSLHINEYNIKRLHDIGLDIEKIWTLNQDKEWKKIQVQLNTIASKLDIELGCPDFINVPSWYNSKVNTCCGINVNSAFTYNTHNWRRKKFKGIKPSRILQRTFEGIGTSEDIENANTIMIGKSKDFYTFKDSNL